MPSTTAAVAEGKLVGRLPELSALRGALAQAEGGSARLVVLEGEAGSGKTALLRAAFAQLGAALLWGDASEFASSEFGPLKNLLRRLQRDAPSVFSTLRQRHPVLDWLLPESSTESGKPGQMQSPDDPFDALARLVIDTTSAAPAVLVFDDMHAADHATVDLLARLAELMRTERLLVVVSHRSDDLPRTHPLRRLRQQWHRAGTAVEMRLPRLEAADALALATARLGAVPGAALADDLCRLGGGLPLYIEELAAALLARGALRSTAGGLALPMHESLPVPESLREAVMLRMQGLQAAAQEALQRASVMGTEVDLELLADGLCDAEAIETLVEAGWLCDTTPGQARFRHALLREAVYAQIPWTRRRRWHGETARALEAAGRSLDAVAEHWLAAHEPQQARVALLARARRACDHHAHADALGHLGRALELWAEGVDEAGRLEALHRLGECAERAGRRDEAARAWSELCERAEAAGAWTAVASGRRRLAVLWGLAGDSERRADECQAAAQALLCAGRRREAAAELAAAADALNLLARWRSVLDLVDRAWPLAVEGGDLELQVLVQSQRGRTLARMGRIDEGVAEARAAVDLAESHALVQVLGSAYQRLADCHESDGRYATAREMFMTAAERCAANGQPMQREACRACALPVLVQNGDWALGLAVADEIAADAASPAWAHAFAPVMAGEVRTLRGEFRIARVLLKAGLQALRQIGFRFVEPRALHALALCDWFDGEPARAAAHARKAMQLWSDGEEVHHILPIARILSTLFSWDADADGVASCVDAASVAAQATGQAEALATLAHTLGEAHLVAGRPEQAATEFQTAIDHAVGLPLPFARAFTLRRLAEAQAGSGKGRAAGEHLREAIDTFAALGASVFLQEATTRLRAVAPQAMTADDERRAHAGLTPRQLQILREVSRGHTDKQIARAIGLSHRTVEMHVQRLMATLHCRTRVEAVARAGELKLLGG